MAGDTPADLFEHPVVIKTPPVDVLPLPQLEAWSLEDLPPLPPSPPLHTNPPPVGTCTAFPLTELLDLFPSKLHQTSRCVAAEEQLHRSHRATARTSRLLRLSQTTRRILAECVQLEDKTNFVTLYDAIGDALSVSSPSPRQGNSEQDDSEGSKSTSSSTYDGVTYPISFLDSLPTDVRQAVLEFLSQVRNDATFLTDRLTRLSKRDFLALFPASKPPESVFRGSHRSSLRGLYGLENSVNRQRDALASCDDWSSPLETLIRATRGSASRFLHGEASTTGLWASLCSQLIVAQRPGSEKFVPAVLDVWTSASPWVGKDRLELWILETLREGAFLLEKPAKPTFRMHAESQVDVARRQEAFFTGAVTSLLELLGNLTCPSVIPEGALAMCSAIFDELKFSPGRQTAFPSFVGTRWLVTSFLPDVIGCPEAHGIGVHHFISELAQQRILREVISRTQRVVVDVVYVWKLGNRQPSELVHLVSNVLKRFEGGPSSKPYDIDGVDGGISSHSVAVPCDRDLAHDFISLSTTDVVTLVHALYPPARNDSESEQLSSGLLSSASSVSGLSLFKRPTSWEQLSASSPSPPPLFTTQSSMIQTPQAEIGLFQSIASLSDNNDDTPFLATLEPDHQLLLDACVAIEDYIRERNDSECSSHAFLVYEEERGFRTVRDELTSLVESEELQDEEPSLVLRAYDVRKCEVALRDLLEEDCEALWQAAERFVESHPCSQPLRQALIVRQEQAQQCSNFLAAHFWFQHVQAFDRFMSRTDGEELLVQLLKKLVRETRRSIAHAEKVAFRCETWLGSIRRTQEKLSRRSTEFTMSIHMLRNQMWYVADVRLSSAYDEARLVSSALRTMGKEKTQSRARQQVSARPWTAPKPTGHTQNFHSKTEAQILDLLCASRQHGGPNKLSDDQAAALQTWMLDRRVENLCRGEEALHKLCMEVQKCVDRLIGDPVPSSAAIWSNPLFRLESQERVTQTKQKVTTARPVTVYHDEKVIAFEIQPQQGQFGVGTTSDAHRPLSTHSSRDRFEARSPTLTTKSSAPFWSPAVTEVGALSSATSVDSARTQPALPTKPPFWRSRVLGKAKTKVGFAEGLRQHLVSSLLSDFTSVFFSEGSETDRVFWTGLGGELADKHLSITTSISAPHTNVANGDSSGKETFDFNAAFQILLRRFAASPCPTAKLSLLHDIDLLLERQDFTSSANNASSTATAKSDRQVIGFRRLFSDKTLRPPLISQDLQFIAAFVPTAILDDTTRSAAARSFWNAAVALTQLRTELRSIMVETADSIIAYHSNNRGLAGGSTATNSGPTAAQQERDAAAFPARAPRTVSVTPSNDPFTTTSNPKNTTLTTPQIPTSQAQIPQYTMSDAAHLLSIAAKDGDSAAQRELGTLYLTHPELLPLLLAPLARPAAVFPAALESKWRKHFDPARCDPAVMCVALHWMNLGARGGDALAIEYLRQRDEMEKLG